MANHFFHPDLTSGLGGHLSNMDISRFRTSSLSWVKQNEVNFNDGSFFGKTTNKKSGVSTTSPHHKEMPSFQHSYQVLGSLTQMKMIPMKATRGLRHLGPGWECEKPVMTCGRSRLVWKDLTSFWLMRQGTSLSIPRALGCKATKPSSLFVTTTGIRPSTLRGFAVSHCFGHLRILRYLWLFRRTMPKSTSVPVGDPRWWSLVIHSYY